MRKYDINQHIYEKQWTAFRELVNQVAYADMPAKRRRPADRRDTILTVAAANFSANGYRSTRLDTIADEVGISVPALYRHFPNKYALFAATSHRLAEALRASIADVDDALPPTERLSGLLRGLIDASVENRGGGLYRWQARFLDDQDAAFVRDVSIDQHRRIRSAIADVRAELGCSPLDPAQANAFAAAATSIAGSPSTHRATLPTRQVESILLDAALAMVTQPDPPASSRVQVRAEGGLAPSSKRELILRQSIPLFAQRGFHEVSVEDIASSVNLPTSGVYRHYESKSAILEAAFWRFGDRMLAAIDNALASAQDPRDAVARLVSSYVDLCEVNAKLVGVYLTEIGSLPDEQQVALRKQQRRNIDEWASWIQQCRPEVSLSQARFLVHAALNVAGDLARTGPVAPALSAALMRSLLLDSTP